jgi:hypothetical protein
MNVLFLFYQLKKIKNMKKEHFKIIMNTKYENELKVQIKKNPKDVYIIQVIDKEKEDGEGHISFDEELGEFFKPVN